METIGEHWHNQISATLQETKDIDQAIQNFIQSPIDMDNDPMVNVKLIRSEQYDVLGFKVNHACCDGAGAKEYIQLLAEIYSSIDQENGTFIPEPRIAGRKDQDRLFAELGITNPDSIFIPGSDILIPTWSFPWEAKRIQYRLYVSLQTSLWAFG